MNSELNNYTLKIQKVALRPYPRVGDSRRATDIGRAKRSLLELRLQQSDPLFDTFVSEVRLVSFVDAETDELAILFRFSSIVAVAFRLVSTDEGAARTSEAFVDLSQSFAEAIGIAISVTATEESDLLASEALLSELGEEVFPVVLKITDTPRRGTEEEDIEGSCISSVCASDIIDISFCAEGLSQTLCYFGGRARSCAVENTDLAQCAIGYVVVVVIVFSLHRLEN